MVGRMQTEDFELESLLGTGSFGKVYLVKRRKDGKQFVFKEADSKTDNAWMSKMIAAEVKCMQILRHPNVVSYYGTWEDRGKFYILMEYAARGTLKNLLDSRTTSLLEQDALYLFAQVVLGVHHIHSKNILHRDLKPENIMLTGHRGDVVKIGDFGLSKCIQENSMSHAGSFNYIAPEMLKKGPYDFKSDIWSMGVVFYEMLTKEFAFPATSVNEIVEKICKGTPRLFKSTKVSRGSQIIIYKILQQQPSKRPTSKLLLLNSTLVPYVAKVYLNLGRAYNLPPESFGTHIFEQFVSKFSNAEL